MESSRNNGQGLGISKSIRKDGGLPRQPRVYNIRRSEFRAVVQRLTGASSTVSHQRRLHQARPPPLSPVPRPPTPPPPPVAADSPLSAYMRFLETSLLHSDGSHRPAASPLRPPHAPPPPPAPAQMEFESPSAFLDLPSPGMRRAALTLSPAVPLSPLLPPSPTMFLASPTWNDMWGVLDR